MKKIVLAVAAAAGLAFAGTAEAQFQLDLKLGYAIPTGSLVTGGSMSDDWSGSLPIGIDARYRFTPNLSAGIYFQWNPAFIASGCSGGGVSCSGYDMRTGLEVAYAFMPSGSFNPWVSLGTGWEWTSLSVSGAGASGTFTFNGWEYFNVQAGVDFPLSTQFAIGPYLGYFGGTYSSASGTINVPGIAAGSGSGSIPSDIRSFHGWFQFGIKGSLNL